MLGYVDGTLISPPRFEPKTSSTLDTKYLVWKVADQRILCLLLSSLTEEAIVVVVGLSTARDIYLTLDTMFSNHLKSRKLSLPVPSKKFVTNFMSLTEPSRTLIKCTGFFHGLGTKFFNFSTTQKALSHLPCFEDLVSKAESFELFKRSLESSGSTLRHSQPLIMVTPMEVTLFLLATSKVILISTTSPIEDKPTRVRVVDHLAAKYVARRAIMLSATTNDIFRLILLYFNMSCFIAVPKAVDWF